MTVKKSLTRKAIVVEWDPALAHADDLVDIKATNPDTGDISDRKGLKNDGEAVFTVPADYKGSAHFTVTDQDNPGVIVDEGDVTI